MSDLDKDIEIVKEVQAIFEHLKIHGWVKDITKEVDIDKVIQAIEKVLWALNGKDCVIETQSHNEEVLEEYIAKLEQELETYKKIAEKLAEKLTYERGRKQDYMFCIDICEENWCDNKNCNQCMENIIEWARNEVEE